MIRFEFSKSMLGKGKGHIGYAIESWVTIFFITLIHLKPVGIRGVVSRNIPSLDKN